MSKEKRLIEYLTQVMTQCHTSSLELLIRRRGHIVAEVHLGPTHSYFDLSSLTKVLFANTGLMYLWDRKKLNIDEPIQNLLPWVRHKAINVKKLMTHHAGLSWWKPLYLEISQTQAHPSVVGPQRWERLKGILSREKLKPSARAIYSDLDYFMLAFVLERVFEKPLLDIFLKLKSELGFGGLHFNPNNRPSFAKSLYAPTEKCSWRKRVLQGEVHDENAWSLGGVSTHAGLFGGLKDVDQLFSLLRRSYLGHGPLSSATLKKFWTRATPERAGDWTLGYMLPTRRGSLKQTSAGQGTPMTSAGQYFSKTSVGHTGFTGTSLWYDLENDFYVILLTNRIHPTRSNTGFVSARAPIHDFCYQLYCH